MELSSETSCYSTVQQCKKPMSTPCLNGTNRLKLTGQTNKILLCTEYTYFELIACDCKSCIIEVSPYLLFFFT